MTLDLSTMPVDTRLRARDGTPARIVAQGLKAPRSVVVAYQDELWPVQERVDAVRPDGKWHAATTESPLDIVKAL